MSNPSEEKPNRKPGGRRGEEPRRSGPLPIVMVIGLVILAVYMFTSSMSSGVTVPYGYFLKQLDQNNVQEVSTKGEVLLGIFKETPKEKPKGFNGDMPKEFNTVLLTPYAGDSELGRKLEEKLLAGEITKLEGKPAVDTSMQILSWLALPLIILFIFYIIMRRSADPFSGGMMGGFIRSPARKFEKQEKQVTYDDVAGLKNAKQDLQEIVEFLKQPKQFTKLGARIPKGVLLVGPPGTGKTLLARATAGEAGVPFFSINGSEFIQMFVGVGATRVRDLFKTAREASPCIVFIDEIDAVGRVRGAGVGGGHDEREQTLNQILSEMDGFEQTEAVIVLAATNRSDVLDPALLRPGRFDRHVTVDRPAREGRLGILKVHTKKVPLADDVDLDALSRTTMGYSGAELEKLVNESALCAARQKKRCVEMSDFYYAEDLITMGARRAEHVEERERRLTAWHEAGHAVLAWYQEGMDPVHKVSIVPRGNTGGVTRFMPEKEVPNVGRSAFIKRIIVAMGGRAAEKLIFDEYSAGAQGDIEQGTRIARHMVAHWGMSEKVGPVAFKQSEEHPFLGKEMHSSREFSEETARIIDIEVQDILKDANQRAIDLLIQYREKLDSLAEALLEHEDIDREQLVGILGPRPGESAKGSEEAKVTDGEDSTSSNADSGDSVPSDKPTSSGTESDTESGLDGGSP